MRSSGERSGIWGAKPHLLLGEKRHCVGESVVLPLLQSSLAKCHFSSSKAVYSPEKSRMMQVEMSYFGKKMNYFGEKSCIWGRNVILCREKWNLGTKCHPFCWGKIGILLEKVSSVRLKGGIFVATVSYSGEKRSIP